MPSNNDTRPRHRHRCLVAARRSHTLSLVYMIITPTVQSFPATGTHSINPSIRQSTNPKLTPCLSTGHTKDTSGLPWGATVQPLLSSVPISLPTEVHQRRHHPASHHTSRCCSLDGSSWYRALSLGSCRLIACEQGSPLASDIARCKNCLAYINPFCSLSKYASHTCPTATIDRYSWITIDRWIDGWIATDAWR